MTSDFVGAGGKHVLDQILDQVQQLLIGNTEAQQRVTRDRSDTDALEASELPAIDIQLGPTSLVQNNMTRIVENAELYVDHFVLESEERVSSSLLFLHRQSFMRIMREPYNLGLPELVRDVDLVGTGGVARFTDGAQPMGTMRSLYQIQYQYSAVDPSRA